jgi:hypothetical protein
VISQFVCEQRPTDKVIIFDTEIRKIDE